MQLPTSLPEAPAPANGTLAQARALYQRLQEAVSRGDTDEQILAANDITSDTLAVLRRDPLFQASLTELR